MGVSLRGGGDRERTAPRKRERERETERERIGKKERERGQEEKESARRGCSDDAAVQPRSGKGGAAWCGRAGRSSQT